MKTTAKNSFFLPFKSTIVEIIHYHRNRILSGFIEKNAIKNNDADKKEVINERTEKNSL